MVYYVYVSLDNGDTWSVSPAFGDIGYRDLWLEGFEMGVFLAGKADYFAFRFYEIGS